MAPDEGQGLSPAQDIDETGTTEVAPGLSYVETTSPYDPQQRLDTVRSQLAFCLIGLLALIILGAFVLLMTAQWTKLSFADIRMLIEIVTTPVIALVSAATGFYFGAHVGSARGRNRGR